MKTKIKVPFLTAFILSAILSSCGEKDNTVRVTSSNSSISGALGEFIEIPIVAYPIDFNNGYPRFKVAIKSKKTISEDVVKRNSFSLTAQIVDETGNQIQGLEPFSFNIDDGETVLKSVLSGKSQVDSIVIRQDSYNLQDYLGLGVNGSGDPKQKSFKVTFSSSMEQRAFLTAREINKTFDLNEDEGLRKYEKKYLIIEGVVEKTDQKADEFDGEFYLQFKRDPIYIYDLYFFDFAANQIEMVKSLKKGQTVAIKGNLEVIGAMLMFNNCTIEW